MYDIGYPDIAELVDHERKTVEFLCNQQVIAQEYPEFAASAKDTVARTKGTKTAFEFESRFSGSRERGARLIYVGARISAGTNGGPPNVSHHLTVCDDTGTPPRLLRKFHFDYDPLPREPSRPFMHLQYAGKLSRFMSQSGIQAEHADTWLSEPRIPCAPVSLAILIHLSFRDFPSDKRAKLIEDSCWRALVRRSEKLMCQSFYAKCVEVLERTDKGCRLLLDFFDGR